MPDLSSALHRIIDAAHTPAISYAYAGPKAQSPGEFSSTSATLGKKSTQPVEPENPAVNDETRFPASSLSKIAFTYLVLQLAKKGQIDLDEPLLPILQREHQEYERFKVKGEYPAKAMQVTARDVLSHTSGLPNFVGPKLASELQFTESPLGTEYLYSGESFLFLQTVLEAKTHQNLEELAQEYMFKPLKMGRSTFLPNPQADSNIVMVHTELEKPVPIEEIDPPLCAAGSLLTTASDFAKFMSAWLVEMNDPVIKQAFEFETSLALSEFTPEEFDSLLNDDNTKIYLKNATSSNYRRIPFSKTELENLKRAIDESTQTQINALSAKLVLEQTRPYKIGQTCGLGWHLYKDDDKVIAYQYGENPNTRSFIAINVTDKKGAVFFTNSENGMGIANQVLSSPEISPIGDMKPLFKHMSHYTQCDEPGWQATIEGKIYEDAGNFIEARRCFVRAADEALPTDASKKQRLDWFDIVHGPAQTFMQPLQAFEGIYKNPYGEKREIYIKNGGLVCKEFEHEMKLVRISETEFLPEKNQDFKVKITKEGVVIHFIHSDPKFIFEQSLPESREHTAFFSAVSTLLNKQPSHEVQAQHDDAVEVSPPEAEDTADLEASRELTQRFRHALTDVRTNIVPAPQQAEEAADNNNPHLSSPSL